MLYVVTGPEKSGKSAKAEALAVSLGKNRIYLAAMIPYGREGAERVKRHRILRQDKGFITIERAGAYQELILSDRPVVLLECIPNLTANEMFGTNPNQPYSCEETVRAVWEDILSVKKQCKDLVVVTGELLEEENYNTETKAYIRAVHQINERLFAIADYVMTTVEENPPYFPLFFSLSGKKVLVAGAGTIASRRVEALKDFGATILVVAPDGTKEMESYDQNGDVHWEHRLFRDDDIKGAFLVLAATNNPKVNDQIAELCREAQIMVNHAGDRNFCDFYFPSVAREKNLVAGITASGLDHKLAKRAGSALKKWLYQFTNTKQEERHLE